MALESASFIAQLNIANPTSTDTVSQADDHLRLIKSVLKNTFPNLDQPVTATPANLNSPVPKGVIVMWSGTIATIPTGWALCNGSNSTPDLRGRFIMGASNSIAPGTTGGSSTSSAAGSHTHTEGSAGGHNHTGATGSHVLTTDEIPAHSHTYIRADLGLVAAGGDGAVDVTSSTQSTSSVGGGLGHNHSISTDGAHTHTINSVGDHTHTTTPPYYALAYIIKL